MRVYDSEFDMIVNVPRGKSIGESWALAVIKVYERMNGNVAYNLFILLSTFTFSSYEIPLINEMFEYQPYKVDVEKLLLLK